MDSGWVRDHAVTQIVRATIFNKLIFYARPRSQLSIQRRYAQQMFDPGAQGPASAAAHAAAPTSSASCTPPKEGLHRLVALKKHEFQAVEYILSSCVQLTTPLGCSIVVRARARILQICFVRKF